MESSGADDETFASIVAHLGDVGGGRSRWVALGVSVAVGTLAVAILAFVVRWPWQAIVVFVLTFVISLVSGFALITRNMHRRMK